jgi:hypothetical protein
MAWNDPTAEIAADQPIRASSIAKIQANIAALAAGTTGAPRVQPAGLGNTASAAGALLKTDGAGGYDLVPDGGDAYDDFAVAPFSEYAWSGGSGATPILDGDAWGVRRLRLADSIGNIERCHGIASSDIPLDLSLWSISARIRLPSFSGGVARYMVGVFGTAIHEGRPTGIYAYARQGQHSDRWQLAYRISGNPSYIDTGIPVTTDWIQIELRKTTLPAGGPQLASYVLRIDGNDVADADGELITLPAVAFGDLAGVALGQDGDTGGNRDMHIDWLRFQRLLA